MGTDIAPAFQGWHTIDPIQLFDVPVVKFIPDDNEPMARSLRTEARRAQWLILWLDCDREGENIAYEVIDVCTKSNPRLRILRAHFSSLVPREIHNALKMEKLTPPDENLSHAVDTRIELDLRIGYAFTRFQSMRFKRRFVELQRDDPISYGPCQFPTLGFVVDRYWKRKAFRPENYWCIRKSKLAAVVVQ
jgi:DNA topoisomerase III